jgi:Lysyl oxidase/IPT/TIG domain
MHDQTLRAVARGGVAAVLMLAASVAVAVPLIPNLQPLRASDMSLATNASGGTDLRFSTTSWNSGLGPLELVAGDRDSATLRQDVFQRIYDSDGSYADYLAGTFAYHPEHNHFHFENYAVYVLQSATANGASDRTSSKTTFCLMDTGYVNRSLPGAPQNAVYTTCGATIQGMSVGWGDRYYYGLPGQAIDVTGLPEGDYKLSIVIDPNKRIIETNDDDNVSCVLLHLKVPTSVTVVPTQNDYDCTPAQVTPPQVATVSSIAPTSGTAGGTVTVTITGSNFAPGMAVTFANGSGPPPQATVTSVSASTITASVKIKRGGNASDPVWDLHVGSGVLPNAFTVTR